MKFKDWLIVAVILVVGYFVLTNHASSHPGTNLDEYYEKKQEARIEEELYKHEIWQQGYDEGYAEARRELEGELEQLKRDVEYAYDAGLDQGYEACLEEYGLSGD